MSTRPSARETLIGEYDSVARPSADTKLSLMKFSVALESMRAWMVEERPISETDRWIRFREYLVSEVLIRAVLKPLTLEGLETGSFPETGDFPEIGSFRVREDRGERNATR